jgi:rfaE bifunctional protein nucleotidyltransferase chain/domain
MQINKFDFVVQKIHTMDTLSRELAAWRLRERKVVFTNGCFDLLHYGHIDYLSRAASLGDELVVGLNTDASVSAIKGEGRPVNDQRSRLHIMASLFFVSAVILFDEPTPLDLIKKVKPDFLVKGGDYKPEDVVGYKEVKELGGEVVCLDFVAGYSTSGLEQKILQGARMRNHGG